MVKRTGLLIRDAKTQPLLEYILPAVNWLAFANNRPGLGTIADLNKRREESEARTGRDFRIPLRLRIERILEGPRGLFEPNLPLVQTQDAIHLTTHNHREAFVFE